MIRKLLLISTLSLAPAAYGIGNYKLLDVDDVSMEFTGFGSNRDPLTPEIDSSRYVGRIAVRNQLRLFSVAYWQNWFHTEGTDAQLQTVGWQSELGLRLSSGIDLFYLHHSRHRMDSSGLDADRDGRVDKFPVEDSYGIRIRFYLSNKPQKYLFE